MAAWLEDLARYALLALVLLVCTKAQAGREELLYNRVMDRVHLLNNAASRCQQRIASGELDECDVNVTWENRYVSTSEARYLANQMLASLRTQSVAVKSFIHRLDTSSLSGDTKGRVENYFAKFSNLGFSEQPATPARWAGDYRLWSEMKVTSTCKGDRVDQWQFGELEMQFGTEFGVLSTVGEALAPFSAMPSASGSGPVSEVTFSYAIKGRPNQAGIAALKGVHGRSCAWIWHRVEGSLRCRSGLPELAVNTSGSRFPSHRSWVNQQQRPTIDQGPFASLWDCNQQNTELVR